MLQKKAQVGIKELMMTLVLAGVIAVIGVLIFSNVTNTSKSIFPNDKRLKLNESVTIIAYADADNSTLLAQTGYIANTETVRNSSSGVQLVRNTEYVITLVGGASGELDTRANFTLLNSSNISCAGCGYNNTELKVTYAYNAKSNARLSAEKVDDTALDSFELGVVALIVLAAVVVMATIMMLNR